MTREVLIALLIGLLPTMGVPKGVHLPASDPFMVRSNGCADDVLEVTRELVPEAQVSTWAPIVFVFAQKESACRTNPAGFNDDGNACGVLQVHTPEKIVPGATCAKVRADRKLGLRVGLTLMLAKAKECGSIRGGLTAFAMRGECPKGWTLPLVVQRCKLAGGVC